MKCDMCGKIYDIEDTHYDPYLNKRFCNKCWKVHKKNRDLMKDEMNKMIVEEMIAARHAEEDFDDED